MRFAFLSDGKLFLKIADAAPRALESPFAAESAERAKQRRKRHSWKGAGRDPQDAFNANVIWGRQAVENEGDGTAAVFRQLAAGAEPGELVYALEMSASSGLFRQDVETGEEDRIFHRQAFFCGGISCDPETGDLVYSAGDRTGLASLERISAGSAGGRALTDGDARDAYPAHDPSSAAIVYQSAGAGRDGEGHLVAFGPAAILRLDPETSELQTLAESDHHDYLTPRLDRSGNLYFIRRPYQERVRPGLLAQVKAFLLMPYHLLRAIFGFMDAFTRIFARTPLRPAGGPEQPRRTEPRWIQLYETSVELEKCLRQHENGDESASLVPASWELVRRSKDGDEEILATRVACFALGPDDALLYSNGFKVWHQSAGAAEPTVVHRGKLIQALAIV